MSLQCQYLAGSRAVTLCFVMFSGQKRSCWSWDGTVLMSVLFLYRDTLKICDFRFGPACRSSLGCETAKTRTSVESDWFDMLLLGLWLSAFRMLSHNDLVNGSVCHRNYARQTFSETHTASRKPRAPQSSFSPQSGLNRFKRRWSHFCARLFQFGRRLTFNTHQPASLTLPTCASLLLCFH